MSDSLIDTSDILASLTPKQREVMSLLGEGRTGKEIAHSLGVSESAVIQRIENIRKRFDGAARHELGRIWRESYGDDDRSTYKNLTGNFFQLPSQTFDGKNFAQDDRGPELTLRDSVAFDAEPPWRRDQEPRLVPEVLDGKAATTFRWIFVFGAALGLLCVLLVLLSVAQTIGEMM